MDQSAMYLRLENFRRFYKPARAPIAPITILLGENSSGKTSFAAGFRYMLETMSTKGEGSFNREPFFLGAFDQIAHYRGGRYGRSASFSMSLHIEKDELETFAKRRTLFASGRNRPTHIDLKLIFENAQSQPILSQVNMGNAYVQTEMKRSDLPLFRIKRAEDRIFSSVAVNQPQILFQAGSSLVDRNSIQQYWGALQNYAFFTRRGEPDKKPADANEIARAEAIEMASLGPFLFTEDVIYASAPFRTRPERTYSPVEASSSAEGAHIPILLAQAKAFEKDKWLLIKEKLEVFGNKSQMFKKVDIKRMGRHQSDPFQIIITVSKDHSNLIDVGYGVSQILPLLVETLINDNSSFFIFQQPEVHLHPRAQAELGSYFLDFVIDSQKYVMLETHSDFMIDRIRSEIQSRGLDPKQYLSVLFFERNDFETKITQINFDELGNVTNAPLGYRAFFVNEAARNLGF